MALTERQYFALRRLHSLSGVFPIGVFLAEHFFTNSFALHGAESYNAKVEFLTSLPYLYLIEGLGIFLPILFHLVVGVIIFREARFNNRSLNYRQNAMFALQRISGVVLIFFIAYHLAATRFGAYFGYDTSDLFALMSDKLQNPFVVAFYVIGVCSASYHLGNGLWGFAIHWGLLTGRRAQQRWSWAALALAVALAVTGLNSLLAFRPLGLEPILLFDKSASHVHAVAPAAEAGLPEMQDAHGHGAEGGEHR